VSGVQVILVVAGLLHLGFVAGEMLPWQRPFILQRVMSKRGITFAGDQLDLTATIVHNAGIYNLILAAGLLWSVAPGAFGSSLEPVGVTALRCFFLSGAVVAGLFGLTLSVTTAVQALVGVAGLAAVSLG
jgi:uncharacterized membrane protein